MIDLKINLKLNFDILDKFYHNRVHFHRFVVQFRTLDAHNVRIHRSHHVLSALKRKFKLAIIAHDNKIKDCFDGVKIHTSIQN